eukprot:CAMPEP_0119120582 /NCGR_PEP_ID=MMETSP1310-20130426/1558_1 /TAXON_ID=464262 /ORGANISM="Genus nov. species nov., Strain RCC2339" /LENGTH=437 /DNA_ID=CAMNT_0007110069 /DNA_START=89 /DNA_END=1402 /DNA_ORIENTATION=+
MWTTVGLVVVVLAAQCSGTVYNFETLGGIPNDNSLDTENHNAELLNTTLSTTMQPGDTLVIPNTTFCVMGGILVDGLVDVTIQLDGTLSFSQRTRKWPRNADGHVMECMQFDNARNVRFTSSGEGTLNGNGADWWGKPGIGYLLRGENRPRLLNMHDGEHVLIERWFFLNSPYWTTSLAGMEDLEIRFSRIEARRDAAPGHNLYDLTAFNTDGFDVGGNNIWVHDCSVYNQDDCFCIKGTSNNITFERIRASGLGLTIGSVGSDTIRNVTFRDAYMPQTVKGIYLKFNGAGNGLVEDVTYENIFIDEPSQYPIWIGPAQQSDASNPCNPNPCSLCWPQVPGSECTTPAGSQYRNIHLKNITVVNPKGSPGVLFGRFDLPMENIIFEDVYVKNPGDEPFGPTYYCEGVDASTSVALGSTYPVPDCMTDKTTASLAQHE